MESREFESLHRLARASLEANVVMTPEGPLLAAGRRQFGGFWTRDFCFAARGLLAIDRADVVRNHLSFLIRNRRASDHVIARLIDSVPSARRVLAHTALRFLPDAFKNLPVKGRLRVEFLGEHGTIAIDSNALVLRTVADLHRHDPNEQWLLQNRSALQDLLDFCLARTHGGRDLVDQGRFEDWQDSVARTGRTLFVNALFAEAFHVARELGLQLPKAADGFAMRLDGAFFDKTSGVYKSHANLDLVSLDGNLLMITEPALYTNTHAGSPLYRNLRKHPLWSKGEIPGAVSHPDYPEEWISWTTKAVGLRHYHDRLLWAWLSALSAKAALISHDRTEADRIFAKLERLAERDGAIAEVYDNEAGLPLTKTWLYESEMPFSWGAGCVLEALAARS